MSITFKSTPKPNRARSTNEVLDFYNSVQVGADPEVFLYRPDTKQFISAHPYILGSKDEPHKIAEGAYQLDGVAMEFNVLPSNTLEDFRRRINQVFKQMVKDVAKAAGEKGGLKVKPVLVPLAYFNKESFLSLPDDVRKLGCEPDFSAYTGAVNTKPDPRDEDQTQPFRTAAGHIHVGWTSGANPMDPEHFDDCRMVVMFMDYMFSCLYVEEKVNRNQLHLVTKRRELYGKPGAFRPKSYGVEYRTPSNRWINSEFGTEVMWRIAKLAATVVRFPHMFPSLLKFSKTETSFREHQLYYVTNTVNHNLARTYKELWFLDDCFVARGLFSGRNNSFSVFNPQYTFTHGSVYIPAVEGF